MSLQSQHGLVVHYSGLRVNNERKNNSAYDVNLIAVVTSFTNIQPFLPTADYMLHNI